VHRTERERAEHSVETHLNISLHFIEGAQVKHHRHAPRGHERVDQICRIVGRKDAGRAVKLLRRRLRRLQVADIELFVPHVVSPVAAVSGGGGCAHGTGWLRAQLERASAAEDRKGERMPFDHRMLRGHGKGWRLYTRAYIRQCCAYTHVRIYVVYVSTVDRSLT